MSTLLKGLIMTVIVFLATVIKTSGIPADALAWQILGITTLGTIIVYVVQSLTLPTTSPVGTISILDFIKGAVIALGNMLATFGAASITGTTINWMALLASMGTILVAYFVKQLAGNPTPMLTPSTK